jgi:hypothetical protein
MLRFRDDHVIDTWIGFTADRSWATGDVDQPRVGRRDRDSPGRRRVRREAQEDAQGAIAFSNKHEKAWHRHGCEAFCFNPLAIRTLVFLLFSVINSSKKAGFCLSLPLVENSSGDRHSSPCLIEQIDTLKYKVSMTPHTCVYLIATVLAVMGWQSTTRAEDDVTVLPTPVPSTTTTQKALNSDGTPVVHKSLHKRKHLQTASGSNPTTPSATATSPMTPVPSYSRTVVVGPAVVPPPVVVTVTSQSHAIAPAKPLSVTITPVPSSVASLTPSGGPTTLVPSVETGLPVARYPGMGAPIQGVSTYVPMTPTLPAKSVSGTTTHQPYYASVFPASVLPLTSTGNYSTPSRTTAPTSDFTFTNYSRKSKANYPWKTGIITTMFWIGEGGSSISPTDNIGSAWDEHWRSTNRGNDDPDERNGYASAEHASTVNPFYVALPFNDLAFPDKARDWVPRSWHRPPEDGKQVSACKDRWVWIKNSNGRSCFAQWEDVGPLRTDHAEYVFGDERPDTYTRAGLDISPAVAKYLGIDGDKRAITSWRFVDDEDVPPGQWLRYDEEAVIFTAMHQMRNSSPSASDLPIQRAAEPIDDQNDDANKKKVDASKG